MHVPLRFRLLQAGLIVLPLAFGIAGCETLDKLNPFAEKQAPLPGERQALFPEGVPGVEFGAPPPQPANSNIPIPPMAAEPQEHAPQTAAAPPPPRPAAPSRPADSNDAWSGTR